MSKEFWIIAVIALFYLTNLWWRSEERFSAALIGAVACLLPVCGAWILIRHLHFLLVVLIEVNLLGVCLNMGQRVMKKINRRFPIPPEHHN